MRQIVTPACAYLFDTLDALDFAGYVGCEYRPRAGTSEGLGWFAPYRGVSPAPAAPLR